MKSAQRLFLGLVATFALAIVSASAQRLPSTAVADEILVKFPPSLSAKQRNATLAVSGARGVRHFEKLNIDHVALPSGSDVSAAITNLLASGEVLMAQPNYIRHATADAPPNDPIWRDGSLWGLIKIQAAAAWAQFGSGDGSVVVADIDTGANYNHPDLAANIWQNPGEIPGNGIDDDDNGYIDDVHGIDTANDDSDPMDDEGHGTHTAGTIAAVGNNNVGLVGVAWNAKIIVCKFLDAAGYGDDADAIECLEYLVALKQRGVNVRATNNSWGGRLAPGESFPGLLKDAYDTAGAAGILNVCAAGNDGRNNDSDFYYPASFTSSSIMSVAASDTADDRIYYSDYGVTSVDLAAPGVNIWSTFGSDYGILSGTSMSTPHVTGAAILLAQLQPSASAETVKSLLMSNVDLLPQWAGLSVSSGRLNVFKAAQAAVGGRRSFQVTALRQQDANEVDVSWEAVPGMRYQVSGAGDLTEGFIPLSGVIVAGQAETSLTFPDMNASGAHKFYRIEIVP